MIYLLSENKIKIKLKIKINPKKKKIKSYLDGMYLEFGDITRPNFQKEIDMERV